MARLLGIRIKNYRALANIAIGQVEYAKGTPLPPLAAFIGRNGAGKSSLLDAFSFVADCLLEGVEAACDKPARGGFARLRTQGRKGPIEFELFFSDTDQQRPIVYKLSIDAPDGIPQVHEESLRQRRADQVKGKPYYFLNVSNGQGKVWAGDAVDAAKEKKRAEPVRLADLNRLGIATLGNLSEHPRIVRFRSYIEQWYLSYFVPDAARTLPTAGAQRFLDRQGSNIGNVLQYMQRQHPKTFGQILENVAKAIPGLKKIVPQPSADGRLLLKFDEAGYVDPFFQQSMSDGTLKMLAYAILLADPDPRPFIGIEEPENGLYIELLEQLSRQFNEQVSSTESKTQILVTTHSTYFVDALTPEQVWIIKKDDSGHAQVTRAADIEGITQLVHEQLPLGSLWYSKHLDG
jgi:predicted ATPase